MLRKAGLSVPELGEQVVTASIGPVTSDAMRAGGLEPTVEAEESTISGIIAPGIPSRSSLASSHAEPSAVAAGRGPGHFSLNVKGGRCEACQGAGCEVIGMHGLPDVELPCGVCGGRRFGEAVLAVKWQGRSIREKL